LTTNIPNLSSTEDQEESPQGKDDELRNIVNLFIAKATKYFMIFPPTVKRMAARPKVPIDLPGRLLYY
jgi:hypothetical protein